MDLKQQILHYYRVDEMSLREIARRTGADRKTVTRLINDFEAAIKADPDTGPNSHSIFLPAAGYRNGTSLDDAGSSGRYWSSSLSTDNPRTARGVIFYSGGVSGRRPPALLRVLCPSRHIIKDGKALKGQPSSRLRMRPASNLPVMRSPKNYGRRPSDF